MKKTILDDSMLVDALAEVFIRFGVEGASLTRLSDASGLGRASLYHRFPGGKEDILQAVVERLSERLEMVLEPAYADGNPRRRAEQIARGISDFYLGGERSCLVPATALSTEDHRISSGESMRTMADSLARVAIDAGITRAEAHDRSIDAVAFLEGALLVSATTNNNGPFHRFIDGLPDRLTELTHF